jgi:hypothetical protein
VRLYRVEFCTAVSRHGVTMPVYRAAPRSMRSDRLLLMLALKAYIDDSNMNLPPVSVLGGWMGPAKDWAHFSDCWAEALWMKPRAGLFQAK